MGPAVDRRVSRAQFTLECKATPQHTDRDTRYCIDSRVQDQVGCCELVTPSPHAQSLLQNQGRFGTMEVHTGVHSADEVTVAVACAAAPSTAADAADETA